jgi:hypothetical protein
MVTVTVGCGTVTASQPVTGSHTTAGGHTGQGTATSTRGPASTPLASSRPSTGAPFGCQGAAAGGQILSITMASNGKTYCARVGEQVVVRLRGTLSSPWLQPLASSSVLTSVPNGELSLVAGLTEGWFAGARPGQASITSVRPPCQVAIPRKPELEPGFPVPESYPLRFCAPERRFSVVIVVMS